MRFWFKKKHKPTWDEQQDKEISRLRADVRRLVKLVHMNAKDRAEYNRLLKNADEIERKTPKGLFAFLPFHDSATRDNMAKIIP